MWSFVVLLFPLVQSAISQCTINVKYDLTYPEPVFLKGDNLWVPSHGQLVWAPAESNLIACPKSNISTNSIVESYRPSFKVIGAPSTVLAAKFVSSLSYLARGHMTPDADGIFRTWQWDTYFYVNVAPQWQKVNGGNWLTVEKAVRSVADRLQGDVLVYTGTAGILTLPHENGTDVPITLNVNGITVPKWTWKIVKSPSENAAIAIITNNDPYRTSIQYSDLLCDDICRLYGWYVPSFNTFSKGFTYCCTVSSLRSVIPTIPVDATAPNVLRL
uniref:DNA/RNA non-specific endonuclease domain-containing protein n=1 Tax=Anopheles farauti TaxID=69004 RepID=A0A182QV83_9DIPT